MAKTILPSNARPALPSAAARADPGYGATADPDWREIDWREHLHWAEIEGKRINYVDIGSGDGPPIVFIHGLSGTWQNWLENLPYFAQKHRCIAMDLPGFGYSDMPAEKISISGYARQVDALCEQLELGRCIVVGNSMGGFVTAELCIRHPERVERACLVAAAGISITNLRRRPRPHGRADHRRARSRVGGAEPLHRLAAARCAGSSRTSSSAIRRGSRPT